jgi:hypothetical protein
MKNKYLRFTPIDMMDIFIKHGAVPNIGVNGDELKFLNLPSITKKVRTDLALNSIFTTIFADGSDGKALKPVTLYEKGIPLVLAHFGNKDEESAERTIRHAISDFKELYGETGITEFELAKVA